MPTSDEIADVLDKAHDELLVRGWTQGNFLDDEDGSVCAHGAVYAALGIPRSCRFNTTADEALYDGAERALKAALGDPCIIDWNDAPGRTIDDVLDLFRHAAKQVREAAQQ